MNYKLARIKIGSRELPIKCDCYVLAQLQQEYGSLSAFEYKLRGWKAVYNEDDRPVRDSDGRIEKEAVEVDVGAVLRLLVLSVNEGIDICGEEPVNEKELIRAVKNPFALMIPLAEEYYRSFQGGDEEKKQQPSRSRKK